MLTKEVYLPGFLYKAVPFVYLLAGILAILGGGSIFGKLAGGVLVLIAINIFYKRITR
jgi:uncharacterized membrane protein YdjX (TVP38/TMEM64 family)